jgi:uroporphyrinogen-III synthase
MRLLVTRPEPDAARSADALRVRGHQVLVAPLLQTQMIAADFGGPFAAILMTSANAARAAAAHPCAAELTALPALTVGARGAEAARAAGFTNVVSAEGALADLVRLAAQRFTAGRLLYLAGEDRAGNLARDLSAHGMAVETAVIYRAVARETLPDEIVDAIDRLDGVLHYSRRSAETLLRLTERAGLHGAALNLAHYCLSGEVAVPLRQAGARRLHIAAHPDETALFALV